MHSVFWQFLPSIFKCGNLAVPCVARHSFLFRMQTPVWEIAMCLSRFDLTAAKIHLQVSVCPRIEHCKIHGDLWQEKTRLDSLSVEMLLTQNASEGTNVLLNMNFRHKVSRLGGNEEILTLNLKETFSQMGSETKQAKDRDARSSAHQTADGSSLVTAKTDRLFNEALSLLVCPVLW